MSVAPKPVSDLNWCFSTLGCPEKTLAEITALARTFDIGLVELRAVAERLDLPALFTEEYGTAEKLKEWLKDEDVHIASLDSSAKLINCPPEAKEELLGFAQWATDLGIPYIRVFDGGKFNPKLSDEDRDQAAAFLLWWDEERKAKNWTVDIVIETHDALCTASNCLDLAAALENSDYELKILWDAHHTWRKGDEDPLVTWPQIKHMVKHVHFKDSVDVPSARHPFTYTNLGEGQFALEVLLKQLADDGFDGHMSLEWERKWHPYLAPIEDALEQLKGLRK